MGFRRFSHAFSAIAAALAAGRPRPPRGARSPRWRGGATAELVERRRREARDRARLRRFVPAGVRARCSGSRVLPGPAGAVLYRAAALLADEWHGGRARRGHDADRPCARRLRRAGAARAVAARLDSGATDRAVVRDRRRLRGRGLLLAHAGRRRGRREEGGEHRRHRARQRRRRARRDARRPAAAVPGASPTPGPSWAWARIRMPR